LWLKAPDIKLDFVQHIMIQLSSRKDFPTAVANKARKQGFSMCPMGL
jgi:hypothetical protein